MLSHPRVLPHSSAFRANPVALSHPTAGCIERCQVASYAGRIARRHLGRPAVPASAQEARDDR